MYFKGTFFFSVYFFFNGSYAAVNFDEFLCIHIQEPLKLMYYGLVIYKGKNSSNLSMPVLKIMFGFLLQGYESCLIFQILMVSDRNRMRVGGQFWEEDV